MDEFLKAAKIMNDHYAKTLHIPIRVKVNEDWFNKQIENDVIQMSTDKPNSFTGLPVDIDKTIETYEFVYKDEYQEMIDKAREDLFKLSGIPANYFNLDK
jgi:hypothetical protein